MRDKRGKPPLSAHLMPAWSLGESGTALSEAGGRSCRHSYQPPDITTLPFGRVLDALSYLPHRTVMEYRRHQVIYDEDHPSTGLYLIVTGYVRVSTAVEGGLRTVAGIYGAGDFFGEASLLGNSAREKATALEQSSLMYWCATEIEELMQRHPKLGIALIQMLVGRCVDFEERLQSLVRNDTLQRVERALMHLADRLGNRSPGDGVRILPFTQQLLSEYVGASREWVTLQMKRLRGEGCVRYSRGRIEILTDALREQLDRQQQ